MEKTGSILKRYGIKPVKSLGQNFLTDDRIARRIVDGAEVDSCDCVLEVGAGVGSLTIRLAEKAGQVIAVETDRKLIPVLEEVLKDLDNVVIITGDILKLDVAKTMDAHRGNASRLKIVSNLPYYITTPIIMKILEECTGIHSITVMVQKEVADRLTALPGSKDYGALTVIVNYYAEPKKLMNVPPGCFIPPPEVYSSVVRLDVRTKPLVEPVDRETFFNTVRAAFSQRRKVLVNALYNSGNFNLDREEIRKCVEKAGIEPNCRGETLSIMQFAKLSDSLFAKNK